MSPSWSKDEERLFWRAVSLTFGSKWPGSANGWDVVGRRMDQGMATLEPKPRRYYTLSACYQHFRQNIKTSPSSCSKHAQPFVDEYRACLRGALSTEGQTSNSSSIENSMAHPAESMAQPGSGNAQSGGGNNQMLDSQQDGPNRILGPQDQAIAQQNLQNLALFPPPNIGHNSSGGPAGQNAFVGPAGARNDYAQPPYQQDTGFGYGIGYCLPSSQPPIGLYGGGTLGLGQATNSASAPSAIGTDSVGMHPGQVWAAPGSNHERPATLMVPTPGGFGQGALGPGQVVNNVPGVANQGMSGHQQDIGIRFDFGLPSSQTPLGLSQAVNSVPGVANQDVAVRAPDIISGNALGYLSPSNPISGGVAQDEVDAGGSDADQDESRHQAS